MRVATKLVSALVLGVIVLLAIDGYLSVRRETEFFQADMKHDSRLLGHALKDLVADVWRTSGQNRVLALIQDANREEHLARIRWVWLDAPPGDGDRPRVARQKLDSVAHGEDVSSKESDNEGNSYLVTYVPVQVDEQRLGALELSEPLSRVEEYGAATVVRMLGLMGVLVLLSGFAVLLLGTALVGRPLLRLVEKVRRVGQGDLSDPLYLRGCDEFGELAAAVNAMCEQLAESREEVREETGARIAALEQLRQADRLRTVGRLASGIAHELGTPLNVVAERAKLIIGADPPEMDVVESAAIIRTQSERMTTIIRQLLDFTRHHPPQRSPVDLRQLAAQTVELLASLGHKRNATLRLAGEEGPVVAKVDAGQIQQVLTNLIVNAIEAMPQGGKVELGFHRERARPPEEQASEGDYLCISVSDEGEGIGEDDMGRLFEPFFTTKDIGAGTGLGLSIAYGIVREHGGWIDVSSNRGRGSCFSVYLPQEGAD